MDIWEVPFVFRNVDEGRLCHVEEFQPVLLCVLLGISTGRAVDGGNAGSNRKICRKTLKACGRVKVVDDLAPLLGERAILHHADIVAENE